MKRSKLVALSPVQREIMDIVWDQGEAAASQVRQLHSKRSDLARNTVRTMLLRMEDKGWLKHRVVGGTFLYSPALPPEAVIGQKVQEVVDTVCGGSAVTLFEALLEHRRLSSKEIEQIRVMINQSKPKKTVRKKAARGRK